MADLELKYQSDDFDNQIKQYLQEPVEKLTCDPLIYWHGSNFTCLKYIAQEQLAVIGTSVPSERLFSKTGRIMTKERCNLDASHLSDLTFLGSLNWYYINLKLVYEL